MLAKTLVHKAAMPVAVESVRTFAACTGGRYDLEVHSDGSLDAGDFAQLDKAARPLRVVSVEPSARRRVLDALLDGLPLAAHLLTRGGYMSKLEVLASAADPYFYFDSDIIWLRPFEPIEPTPSIPAIFSTETWSWYYGIRKPIRWFSNRTPARVNSGFTFLRPPFRLDRLEAMLAAGLYNPDHQYATDQEILAFLYPDCRLFSLDHFSRSRVGMAYALDSLDAIALHFPGGMWKPHLDQIQAFRPDTSATAARVANIRPAPLNPLEYTRMRLLLAIEQCRPLKKLADAYRSLRNASQA